MFEPSIVKTVKLLRGQGGALTQQEIARSIREEEQYVSRSLDKLVEIRVVARDQDRYHYNPSPTSDQFADSLVALYDKIIQKPKRELLIRGLLVAGSLRYLLREAALLEILESEGFARDECLSFLEEEQRLGHITRVKLAYAGRRISIIPLFIPHYHLSHFDHIGLDEYQRVKEESGGSSTAFQEEDYLMSNYPPELAEPAREYLEKEKRDIRDRLRDEAFRLWFYGRLR